MSLLASTLRLIADCGFFHRPVQDVVLHDKDQVEEERDVR